MDWNRRLMEKWGKDARACRSCTAPCGAYSNELSEGRRKAAGRSCHGRGTRVLYSSRTTSEKREEKSSAIGFSSSLLLRYPFGRVSQSDKCVKADSMDLRLLLLSLAGRCCVTFLLIESATGLDSFPLVFAIELGDVE